MNKTYVNSKFTVIFLSYFVPLAFALPSGSICSGIVTVIIFLFVVIVGAPMVISTSPWPVL